MSIVKIKPAGQQAPRVEKFSLESIVYTLDLTEVLVQNELISSISSVTTDLFVEDSKVKMGRNVLVRIGPNNIGTSTYTDYPVVIVVETSDNNKKVATFTVRVYR